MADIQSKKKLGNVCDHCQSRETPTRPLKACSRCKLANYCGKECQTAHWKDGHKKNCIPPDQRKPNIQSTSTSQLESLLISDDTDRIDSGTRDDVSGGARTPMLTPCSICFENITSLGSTSVLKCGHKFHTYCVASLRAAVSIAQVCPLCRNDLSDGPEKLYVDALLLLLPINEKVRLHDQKINSEITNANKTSTTKKAVAAKKIPSKEFPLSDTDLKVLEQVIEKLRTSADEGSMTAQYTLATFYRDTRLFTSIFLKMEDLSTAQQRSDLSLELFTKAADQGFIPAQQRLGDIFSSKPDMGENHDMGRNHDTTSRYDLEQAKKWYERAASNGCGVSACHIGNMLRENKQYEQSRKYFKQAAEQGVPEGQFFHGIFLTGTLSQHSPGENTDGDKPDKKAAFHWVEKAALAGHKGAQCGLANFYLDEEVGKIDYYKSYQWHMKAALQGVALSQYQVGDCLMKGCGVSKNVKLAFEWMLKSAQEGYLDGEYTVGKMLAQGIGVTANVQQAEVWLKKAVEKGHREAEVYLSAMLQEQSSKRGGASDGGGGGGNNVNHILKLAEQGNATAQCEAGDIFFFGRGKSQNCSLAEFWYLKAGEQNFAEAQNQLACIYSEGKGKVKKNVKKAVEYGELAASQGLSDAMHTLGVIYSNGALFQPEKSTKWLLRGVQLGHADCMALLADLYREEGNDKECLHWLRLAAAAGNGDAMHNLGVVYEHGQLGLKKNEKEARRLFNKAANELNQTDAMTRLGAILFKEDDYLKASQWFKKADELSNGKDPAAARMMGLCYSSGKGFGIISMKTAFQYYLKSAELNDGEGCFQVGKCYFLGEGCPKNHEKFFEYMHKAQSLGNPKADELLTNMPSS